MASFELYGTSGCPYTREMREWLELKGCDFEEFDVESDPLALRRMMEFSGGQRMVPMLVADGAVSQIGWEGRGCIVGQSGHE